MKNDVLLKTPGERLRAIRAYCASSRHAFCSKMGLSESTLKSWENDVAILTKKGAKTLSGMFHALGIFCTQEWLLSGTTPSPLRDIERFEPGSLEESQFIEKEFERLANYYKRSLFLHRITNQHMAPFFKVGDFVGGIALSQSELPYYWDECVIASVENYGFMVRKLVKGSQPGVNNLEALNLPAHHPQHTLTDVTLNTIYRIVWHRSPLDHALSKKTLSSLPHAV